MASKAKKLPQPAPATPAPKKAGEAPEAQRVVRSDDPMDWLFTNPLGAVPGFTFGVLKQSYKGHRNSISEFVARKLRPVIGRALDGSLDPSIITAHRHGTVLPPAAPDLWDDTFALVPALEAGVLSHEPSMLVYVTLAATDDGTLQSFWEEARAFACTLAHSRLTPIICIQHAPHLIGAPQPQHVHLCVSARKVRHHALADYDRELLQDQAQDLLYSAWLAFRKRWAQRE